MELCQYVTGVLLFFVCRALSYQNKNTLLWAMIMTGIFISFLSFYQYFFGFQNTIDYLSSRNIVDPLATEYIKHRRVSSPFILPTALGGYLIMIIPVAYVFKKKRWIVLPLFLALLLTRSMGAILGLLMATAIGFYLQKKLEHKRAVLLLTGLIVAVILICAMRTFTHYEGLQPNYSIRTRWDYWLQSLRLIRTHPWTGTGLGSFDLPGSRYAHNTYLQIWAETGILGITSFLFLLITLLRSGAKVLRSAPERSLTAGLLCAVWAFLIHNTVDFTFFLPEVCLTWCIILGILFNGASRTAFSNDS